MYTGLLMTALCLGSAEAQAHARALAVGPPVQAAELAWFPSQEEADRNRAFARKHIGWLENQWELLPALRREIEPWLEEARWHLACWDALATAHDYRTAEIVQIFLAQLRDLVGTERYYRGEMPQPIPLQRFRMVD